MTVPACLIAVQPNVELQHLRIPAVQHRGRRGAPIDQELVERRDAQRVQGPPALRPLFDGHLLLPDGGNLLRRPLKVLVVLHLRQCVLDQRFAVQISSSPFANLFQFVRIDVHRRLAIIR